MTRSLSLPNRWLQKLVAASVAMLFLALPAVAAAQTVTQAYGISGGLQKGMIVMLDPGDATKVKALSNKKINAMQGVIVAANESAVTLSGDGSTNQVYVATAGKYDVLISNQNGSIKKGDYITISALDGIGMKADSSQTVILGKALEGFDGTTKVSGTTALKTSAGTTTNVAIGLINVEISISHNPLAAAARPDAAVPGFLRRLAESIAGKPVSSARIYICLAVLLVTVFIAGSLLYGGVRSSLVAIGRNPLARRSVLRGLFQVITIGLIIFVIGILAIYLLLKL